MSNDREKILQMVADGTITLEEATRLLECLEVVAGLEEEAPQPEEKESPQPAQPEWETGCEPKTQPATPQRGALFPLEPNQNQYSSATSWIRGLKISWISGPVEIRMYEGDVVNITEYSKSQLREEDKMEITEQDGIIRVKWDRRGGVFSLSSLTRLLGRSAFSKHLVVEIPRALHGKLELLECSTISGSICSEGVAAEEAEFSSTSAAVKLSEITARRLKASSISGSVRVEAITAGEMILTATSGAIHANGFTVKNGDWNSISGKVSFTGSADTVKISTISGGVDGRLDTCPETMEVDTVSGGIKVFLPENAGFRVNYSSVSSRLDSQFPVTGTIGKKSGSAVYGNGRAQIRLGTVSGGLWLCRHDNGQ